MSLTLHEAASEMHPKWQGGLIRPPYKNQFRSHFDITWYSVIELNWIGNMITYFERLTHFFAFLVLISPHETFHLLNSTLLCMSLWGFTNNLTLFVVGLKIYVNWWGGVQHIPMLEGPF